MNTVAGLDPGRRTFIDELLFDGTATLRTVGDLRAWRAMTPRERHRELHMRAYAMYGAAVEPPPSRSPRTALPLLGPWAPKLGPIRIEYHDGRAEHVADIEAARLRGIHITTTGARGVARFRWTQDPV